MNGDGGFGSAILRGLRAAWRRDAARRDRVRGQFHDHPGRAEGRVADWSVDRIAECLRRDGRRRLAFNAPHARDLSADERQVIGLLEDLRDGDSARAHLKAEWLVKPPKVAGLIERMRPLAEIAATHEIADADLHRQSARSVMEAYHHGAL